MEIYFLFLLFSAPIFFGAAYPWAYFSLSGFLFLLVCFFPQSLSEICVLPVFIRSGFLFVFGIIFFQSLFAPYHPYATQLELLKWLAWAGVFLLIQLLPASSLERLIIGLAVLGCLESLYGLWETGTGHEHVLWQKKQIHLGFVTGTYINRNHLAGLLELCLGVHIGFLLKAFRQKRFWVFTGGSLLLIPTLMGFFQTGSRMGFISFCLSLGALSFLLLRKLRRKIIGVFFLMLLFFLGIALWMGRQKLLERWEETVMNTEYWEGGRILVWESAFRVLKDHPWLGTGLGNFEWVFPAYQPERLGMGWAHAHNDYLELAVELGVPAFAVLLLSFSGLGVFYFLKKISPEHADSPLLWGIGLSLTSFAFHGLADFNFAIPANAFIFIFLTAALFRLTTPSKEGL